jgi:DNA-binding NtrC family response regulator
MSTDNVLANKKILVVDDEPDILETLEDLLSMCNITKASTFEQAMELFERQEFEIAILDIMGVDGYSLLEEANEKGTLVVMLTARALDVENLSKAYKEGAASYLPKEKIADIATYLNDIIEAKEKGKSVWWRWLDRLEDYFEEKFGPDWQEEHQIKIR